MPYFQIRKYINGEATVRTHSWIVYSTPTLFEGALSVITLMSLISHVFKSSFSSDYKKRAFGKVDMLFS